MSAMGDVAMTVPALEAVRRRWPEVRITVLTRPAFRPFFSRIADVEFLPADLKGRHKGLFGLLRLAADARRAGVDAVADLHDVLRSKIVRWTLALCGCRTAHIDKRRKERRRLVRLGYAKAPALRPVVERYCDTFRALGFETGELPPPRNIKGSVPAVLECGPKTGLWIGLAPFAGHPGKTYPWEQTEQLAGLLARGAQHVFLFGGGAREKNLCEALASRHDGMISVVGRTDLAGELELMSNLDAIVCMDSSAQHMASLAGTRAVSVWGATHPAAGFLAWGQDPADAVGAEMECRPCSIYGSKPCRKGDMPCMRAVSAEQIAGRVFGKCGV